MRKDIFAIPIFEFEVDLKYINVPVNDEDFSPTWESGVLTSFAAWKNVLIPKSTYDYLSSKIAECLLTLKDPVTKISFDGIWKNKYGVNDFQGYHIHSNTTWSFIIYEDVEESKTQFINPSMNDIQNHSPLGESIDMPVKYIPKLKSGWMILFPSWLPHQVLSGNIGTTISGNITVHVD
jgi:hypothetical protein